MTSIKDGQRSSDFNTDCSRSKATGLPGASRSLDGEEELGCPRYPPLSARAHRAGKPQDKARQPRPLTPVTHAKPTASASQPFATFSAVFVLPPLDTPTSGRATWRNPGLTVVSGAQLARLRREHAGCALQFYNFIHSSQVSHALQAARAQVRQHRPGATVYSLG